MWGILTGNMAKEMVKYNWMFGGFGLVLFIIMEA